MIIAYIYDNDYLKYFEHTEDFIIIDDFFIACMNKIKDILEEEYDTKVTIDNHKFIMTDFDIELPVLSSYITQLWRQCMLMIQVDNLNKKEINYYKNAYQGICLWNVIQIE